MSTLILANFGGPRSLEEVPVFLESLLTDVDVIRTPFPRFFEKWFFRKVAIQRAKKISHDYALIGGKSPIFEDTERLADQLRSRLGIRVIPFHRYLPSTHENFLSQIENDSSDELWVLPLYPQFSFATTGSIARFFGERVRKVNQLRWIKSYAIHEAYVKVMQISIASYLDRMGLKEKEVVLFFSAHGLPQEFVEEGDPYERECHLSFNAIKAAFPDSLSLLAFQSKFGPGQWLRPYTSELCETPLTWSQGRKNVVFIPLSFTSDHIETLFEVEYQYLPPIRKAGLSAYRCPAVGQAREWIDALVQIIADPHRFSNRVLVRCE